jgi:cathepsin B
MKLLILALVILSVFAGDYVPQFDTWSRERLKNYFGVHIEHADHPELADFVPEASSFDGRTQWPKCAWDIQNQADCGSCWSFGLSESIADRWCIAKGIAGVELSPQDAVSCDNTDYGCNGGYLSNSMTYAQGTGIVSRACFPYVSGDGSVPPCPYKCQNSENWSQSKHKISSWQHVTGVSNIQKQLQTYGPCDVAFEVPNEFFSYSWPFSCDYTDFVGGHAVKMLGWGFDSTNNLNYWIIANSWGATWGPMKGYFWLQMGVDCYSIEDNVYCAMI